MSILHGGVPPQSHDKDLCIVLHKTLIVLLPCPDLDFCVNVTDFSVNDQTHCRLYACSSVNKAPR